MIFANVIYLAKHSPQCNSYLLEENGGKAFEKREREERSK
jgi:hypothetical protein